MKAENDPVSGSAAMIAGMDPALDPEVYCFVTVADNARAQQISENALASFKESEGWSFILPLEEARNLGLPADLAQRRIILQVHSALDGIGLTAAASRALAEVGIACNMVAAFHHDHIFVPSDSADQALKILKALAAR